MQKSIYSVRSLTENIKETSDIDIAIDARQRLSFLDLAQARNVLEALYIPQEINIVDMNSIPEKIEKIILEEGIVSFLSKIMNQYLSKIVKQRYNFAQSIHLRIYNESYSAKMLAYCTHSNFLPVLRIRHCITNYLGIFSIPFIAQLNDTLNLIAGENLYIVQRSFKFLLSTILYTFFVHLSHDKNLLFTAKRKIMEGFLNGLRFRFTLDCGLWLFYLLMATS